MMPVFLAAREIQEFLDRAGEKFCFIGAVALQRWGEPRFTRDVDLTLLCDLGNERAAIDRVLSAFKARISEPRAFALKSRVILIESSAGIPIDVALGALPFEQHCAARAHEFDFGQSVRLRICSAEDLVVLKAFAGRGRDWVDLETVLVRQRRTLDWKLIFAELEPLVALRESPETLERLKQLRAAVEKGA
jgi:hypothetical protein